MQKRIFLIYDILSAAGTILTLFMVYLYICAFVMDDAAFNPAAFLFISSMILTDCILRRYVDNLIIYLLLHLIPFAVLLMPGLPMYGMLILGCIGFFVLYSSVAYWKNDGLDKYFHCISFPEETIIFYIIIFIHSYYGLSKSLTLYVYMAGIAFFLISLLKKYLDKIISGIHSANGAGRRLNDKMYAQNSIFVIIFTLFILLFITVVSLVLSESSFNFIGRILRFMASLLAGAIAGIAGDKEPSTGTDAAPGPQGPSNAALPAIESTPSPIANALFILIQIIIYFLIVVGVIYLIYSFFKSYMYRNRNSEDIVEKTGENTDSIVSARRKRSTLKIFGRLSANDKIRRIYYRKVSGFQKEGRAIQNSSTPDEIASMIKENNNVSIDELTTLYKKARYSKKDITAEDIRLCKRL